MLIYCLYVLSVKNFSLSGHTWIIFLVYPNAYFLESKEYTGVIPGLSLSFRISKDNGILM